MPDWAGMLSSTRTGSKELLAEICTTISSVTELADHLNVGVLLMFSLRFRGEISSGTTGYPVVKVQGSVYTPVTLSLALTRQKYSDSPSRSSSPTEISTWLVHEDSYKILLKIFGSRSDDDKQSQSATRLENR